MESATPNGERQMRPFYYELQVPIQSYYRAEVYFNRKHALEAKRSHGGTLILKNYLTKKDIKLENKND